MTANCRAATGSVRRAERPSVTPSRSTFLRRQSAVGIELKIAVSKGQITHDADAPLAVTEDDEGRVNSDLEPEDAIRVLLNVDLREPEEDE